MAYLTDKEKRLLFSALTREKKVCVEVDKECCREAYEDTLESVVKNLEKKFYYDRFEKEIRAKAIDEFADNIKTELDRFGVVNLDTCVLYDFIDRKAERLKAGGKNEND